MIGGVLRAGVVLWALCALVAIPLGRAAWLGVLCGGAIGLANFYGLARIVGAVVHASGRAASARPTGRAAMLAALLVAKFALLVALVWASLRLVGAQPIAFLVGISIFVVAIFCSGAAMRRSLGQPS
ncbi:MAG: ATP synthase subunit I [Myxococcota bacterium]